MNERSRAILQHNTNAEIKFSPLIRRSLPYSSFPTSSKASTVPSVALDTTSTYPYYKRSSLKPSERHSYSHPTFNSTIRNTVKFNNPSASLPTDNGLKNLHSQNKKRLPITNTVRKRFKKQEEDIELPYYTNQYHHDQSKRLPSTASKHTLLPDNQMRDEKIRKHLPLPSVVDIKPSIIENTSNRSSIPLSSGNKTLINDDMKKYTAFRNKTTSDIPRKKKQQDNGVIKLIDAITWNSLDNTAEEDEAKEMAFYEDDSSDNKFKDIMTNGFDGFSDNDDDGEG
ncbi:uncharacterized protein BX664DRAFT_337540 [Halteromyces radiatus]|uniref:uncharacterized protein n=1 Tax=Halteromyces radiatus TaxID=101107 RepID=UPI002220BE80|nr:uncharacterized protein BX664DRAFT_337540 [Halteromyces radiatus]KAI8084675.1 hypothetical protein BX664DRAFT_337540 [Halteromyces radiatus]